MGLRHRVIGLAARGYWRIFRPRTLGVRCLLLDGEGRVALVRHIDGKQWYLPGGGVKKGESFQAGLARELAEEVAVTDVRIERLLGVFHSNAEFKDDHIAVFVARAGKDATLSAADPTEIEEARWFAPDALPEGVSPATARRVAEMRGERAADGAW